MAKGRRRGRQEGSIYQRGDGRWTAAVNCGWKNGKRVRKQFYGKTRKDVQDQLAKALRDQQLGLPVRVEKQSVERFLSSWLANTVKSQVRPKTYDSYRQLIRVHVIPALGKLELTRLQPEHVQDLMATILSKGRSPRTVQYVRAVLRRALGQATKWGMVPRNVAALVDPPRVVRCEVQPFSVEEIPALMTAFEHDRLGPLYLLALTHGLRQGEALGLHWQDIDLNERTLRVRHALQWNDGQPQFVETKTKQSKRVIALASRVASALQLHRKTQLEARLKAGDKWRDRGLVFCTRTGGPLQGLNVTRAFQRLLERAGLPRRRFHDLRHTAASFLLYKNVHPRVVADLLGHSEIRVTMDLYSHVAPALQREAADQMDALLAAKQA